MRFTKEFLDEAKRHLGPRLNGVDFNKAMDLLNRAYDAGYTDGYADKEDYDTHDEHPAGKCGDYRCCQP